MTITKKIAILPGDGIGPEVMHEALRVLDSMAEIFGHSFEYLHALIGGQAFDACQSHCPAETLNICHKADAILFGSVGGPITEQHQKKWLNCEVNSILELRKQFDLGVNIRPINIYPGLAEKCPLKNEIIQGGFSCVIFRELTGGLYFGRHERLIKNKQRQAVDECVYDESQIQTIAHAAFKAAQMRSKKICSVDKANVLATSKLWRDVVNEVAVSYPDVELSHMLVDNCVIQMVINPQQFDVILTENMFGDIISDLAASLPGSLGLVPSASLNAQGVGLYEPSGGSAPDIAGKGIANPCAQILSAALMLRYSFGMYKEADLIESAVQATLSQGIITRDLAVGDTKSVSTSVFADYVISAIHENNNNVLLG